MIQPVNDSKEAKDPDEVSILIVDDVAANRLALRLLVRGPGRRILEADSGTDALRILLAEDISLILLDIEMPDMDGFETADLIRGSSRLKEVPIIFQSAHGSNSRVIQGYGLGAVDFIQKPIVPEILQARVDVFLSLQRKTRQLERTTSRLALAEARSRSIVETATDGIITFDQRGVVEMFNPAAERMFGYSAGDIVGGGIESILIFPEGSTLFGSDGLLADGAASPVEMVATDEARGRRSDGSTFPLGVSVSNVDSAGDHFFSAIMRDLTEVKRDQEQLTRLARYDFLTGLANRVTFEDQLKRALAHARRYDGNGALLYLDLDRFKSINDLYGHRIGDLLLQEASKRLAGCLRETDVLARLGGDEFCIVVDHLTDQESVTTIAKRVVDCLHQPFQLDDLLVEVSASVGIALFLPNDDTTTEVLMRADRAMYAAKRLGGDQFAYPDQDETPNSPTFVEEVMQALRSDGFVLHYQPVVALDDMRTVDVEALIRWNRAGHGLLTPKSFLRAIEASGMIIPVGRWMIDMAIRHAAAMPPQPAPPGISVNLSLRELTDQSLIGFLEQKIQLSGIDPERICFEIAESVFFNDWTEAKLQTARLQELGVRVALDGFGLNHGSMSALTEIPCDLIKLDRSLIVSIDSDSKQRRSVVESIISVAHDFGRAVAASGVEREAQVEVLTGMGCDLAQGLYFAEPAAPEAVGAWMWNPPKRTKRIKHLQAVNDNQAINDKQLVNDNQAVKNQAVNDNRSIHLPND